MAQPGEGRTFDLLVVGGGINGAAIARDAALRGLSVCLVEANDWGWATTAKSSKLAHGGLRYLELFEFGLVKEALGDRERMLRNAPHLVRPLPFIYPIYPEVASRRTVRVGLMLYDALSRGKSIPGRGRLSAADARKLVPALSPEGLAGASTFFDGQIQMVERLVLEMVQDARANGAVCLNRTRVQFIDFEASGPRRVRGAVVEDEAGNAWRIEARTVVNATGAWVDETLGPLAAGKPPKVRLTKGIHVVVPRFLDVALLVKARDGRTFFVMPWQDHAIIGTTDTDYEGDPAHVVAEQADVRYLVEAARRYLPGAPLDQVRYTYAGVRALVNEQGVTESNVTRRHILYDHGASDGVAGLWSLQGGKITTARSLAEECVTLVARHLGQAEKARLRPTEDRPYPGCPSIPWDTYRPKAVAEAVAAGLRSSTAARLVDAHGARWRHVLLCDPRPEALDEVPGAPGHLFAQVTLAVRDEDARHLGDVLLRRTTMGHAADGNPLAAVEVAAWMGDLLGWDEARQEAELEAYRREATQFAVPAPAHVATVPSA